MELERSPDANGAYVLCFHSNRPGETDWLIIPPESMKCDRGELWWCVRDRYTWVTRLRHTWESCVVLLPSISWDRDSLCGGHEEVYSSCLSFSLSLLVREHWGEDCGRTPRHSTPFHTWPGTLEILRQTIYLGLYSTLIDSRSSI